MARLPDVQLDDVAGAAPPATAPQPTSFGLEQAGAELAHTASIGQRAGLLQLRAQASEDARSIAPVTTQLGAVNKAAFDSDAAGYQGEPGFVGAQMDKANVRAYLLRQGLESKGATPGQLAEFDKAAQGQTLAVGQMAGDHAATYAAAPLIQAAKNAQTSTYNGVYMPAWGEAQDAIQQAQLNHAAGDQTLIPSTLDAIDQIGAKYRAQLPAQLQPRFDADWQAVRIKAQYGQTDFQLAHAHAAALGAASQQIDQGVNSIVGNPASYADFLAPGGPAEKLIATLPAGLREDARSEIATRAATARIGGLIANKQGGVALQELQRGDYDGVLTPDQKAEAIHGAQADSLANGPAAEARGATRFLLDQRLKANEEAVANGQPPTLKPSDIDAEVASGQISAEEGGAAKAQIAQLTATAAANGPVFTMTNAQLANAAAAPAPDPSDTVAYAADKSRKGLIAKEIEARQEPGKWVWSDSRQHIGGQPLNTAVTSMWDAATKAPAGAQQSAAMTSYAGTMLGVQYQAGIPVAQLQVVPKETAQALALSVANAAPADKMAAMQGLARLVSAMPTSATAPDGTTVNPRAIFGRQLSGKGALTPIEASTLADFAGNDGAMGRVVQALNNPTLKEPVKRGDTTVAQVRSDLAPFLASDPQGGDMAEARIQRTVLVARQLESQGMSAESAAGAAAKDLTGSYVFQHGYRVPAAVANQPASAPVTSLAPAGLFPVPLTVPGQVRGDKAVDIGTAQTLAQLTANGGAGLAPDPSVAGDVPHRQQNMALKVQQAGAWKTLPDDSGVALVLPKPDGRYTPAKDVYGRNIQLTWAQAQAVAAGQPSPFSKPPPSPPAVTTPTGAPVRSVSPREALSVVSPLVEGHESAGENGLVSNKGALGLMQLMPDTVQAYSAKLGLPYDLNRAQNDPAYNRTIGNAYLGDLLTHFMTGAHPMAGVALALAAYSAGQGRVEGFTKDGVYHPGWLQTLGDPRSGAIDANSWAARIPGAGFKETRDYVNQVFPRAMSKFGVGE